MQFYFRIFPIIVFSFLLGNADFSYGQSTKERRLGYAVGGLTSLRVSLPHSIYEKTYSMDEDLYINPSGLSLGIYFRLGEKNRTGISFDSIISTYTPESGLWYVVGQLRPSISLLQYNRSPYRGLYIGIEAGSLILYTDSPETEWAQTSVYPSGSALVGIAIPFGYRFSLDPLIKLSADYVENEILYNVNVGVRINL